MSKCAYGKVLGTNELGSTGETGKPQRGTFILIATIGRNIFPPMSKIDFNDKQLISILYNDDPKPTICTYVWHNSKFSKPGFGKAWDETRLYLNNIIHPEHMRFKVGDIIIWRNNSESNILHLSHFKPNTKHYDQILEQKVSKRGKHFLIDEKILPTINWDEASKLSPIIPEEVIEEVNSWMEDESSGKQLTSQMFRAFVTDAYGNKCAITGDVIRVGDLMNIEAAHIWPLSHDGPMMADNGIAMDRNLHWAFDKGMFTLKIEEGCCSVVVHPDCMDNEMLSCIDGNELLEPQGIYSLFKPKSEYVEYHRKEIFGLFKTSGSIGKK